MNTQDHLYTNISHRKLTAFAPVHINYRLHGSVPRQVLLRQRRERNEALERLEFDTGNLAPNLLREEKHKIYADYELAIDRELDSMRSGPLHLREPAIQDIIMDSWIFIAERENFDIPSLCVMPNHVHIVCQLSLGRSAIDLSAVLESHKKWTARKANKILGKRGPFWDKNYFDRDVRAGAEERVIRYVIENPVKAGLVNDWRDWRATWLKI